MRALAGIARFLTGSWAGGLVGLALPAAGVLAVFNLYVAAVRADAARTVREEVQNELLRRTVQEGARKQRALEESQRESRVAAERLAALETRFASTLQEIDDASRPNDARVCLDPGGVQRLDALGGRRPGPRARHPRRRAPS